MSFQERAEAERRKQEEQRKQVEAQRANEQRDREDALERFGLEVDAEGQVRRYAAEMWSGKRIIIQSEIDYALAINEIAFTTEAFEEKDYKNTERVGKQVTGPYRVSVTEEIDTGVLGGPMTVKVGEETKYGPHTEYGYADVDRTWRSDPLVSVFLFFEPGKRVAVFSGLADGYQAAVRVGEKLSQRFGSGYSLSGSGGGVRFSEPDSAYSAAHFRTFIEECLVQKAADAAREDDWTRFPR
jgi:hypothetical protein